MNQVYTPYFQLYYKQSSQSYEEEKSLSRIYNKSSNTNPSFRTSQNASETACAESLISLYESKTPYKAHIVMQYLHVNIIPMKSSKKEKANKFKRNINACLEHRKKHQKCPLDCPKRIDIQTKEMEKI